MSGREKNLSIILKYAVAPHPVAFEYLIRMYQLMTKMAEQAA